MGHASILSIVRLIAYLSLIAVVLVATDAEGRAPSTLVLDNVARSAKQTRAIAVAYAERSIAQARQSYAESYFARCVQQLSAAEQRLARSLVFSDTLIADLGLVKQLNQWLGICATFAKRPKLAKAALLRAGLLPGPSLAADMFPPRVKHLADRLVVGSMRYCRIDKASRVWIDGRERSHPGAELEVGQHYALFVDPQGRRHALRIRIEKAHCQLAAPFSSASRPLDRTYLEDKQFLQRAGRLAGVERIAIIDGDGDKLRQRFFDVGSARWSSPLDFAAHAIALPHPMPALSKQKAAQRRTPPGVWYKKWWIWTIATAVLATAIAVPVGLTQRETRYQLVLEPQR